MPSAQGGSLTPSRATAAHGSEGACRLFGLAALEPPFSPTVDSFPRYSVRPILAINHRIMLAEAQPRNPWRGQAAVDHPGRFGWEWDLQVCQVRRPPITGQWQNVA